MKYIHWTITIFLFAVISFPRTAQGQFHTSASWVEISSSTPEKARMAMIHSDADRSRVEISLAGFWQAYIRTVDGMPETRVRVDNSSPIMERGAPDLEKLTFSLAIPDRARMDVAIVEEEYIDYQDVHISPSKGNLTRDIDPDEVPYEYGQEYLVDAFYPGAMTEMRTPHIIRDVRGQTVLVYPFRYNPVQKVLRVYTRLVVEVNKVGEDGENPLLAGRDDGTTGGREEDRRIRVFEGIFERNFLNFDQYRGASRYTPLEEDGNMLIISYGPFMDEMQDLVDWKNMSGVPTEMVSVTTAGTTAAAIKSYVANYYNTNGLTYLLLVGDAAQVPVSSTGAGDSDNDYGYIAGNDHYPDIFVGRFSAESGAQVLTQVERTLDYEKYPSTALGSFPRAMCIASSQGPGDDGEYDWQHERNIRTDYMNFTYTYGAELYDGSQGGEDATGNPTSAMVSTEINTGIGIISYTGHGSNTSWGTSGFSSTGVNNLTNNGMLPFVLSVACVNGNFVGLTCFAEAWLRATHNGEPSGAVATVMSTINQSWNPPMCGQDEMVDVLTEIYPGNVKRSFGGICMNGCMQMNDEYGSAGYAMTDTWTIFGDPSLMVRTATPTAMTVAHAPALAFGQGQLTVTCDQEGARVAISNDYQFLGSAVVSGGSAPVSFTPVNVEDTLTVTVTAFNCLPSIDSVYIFPPSYWLGLTNQWNNPANWSDGAVPGSGSTVIIPESLVGSHYPEDFSGTNPVMDTLEVEPGATLNLPSGVTITVGGQ